MLWYPESATIFFGIWTNKQIFFLCCAKVFVDVVFVFTTFHSKPGKHNLQTFHRFEDYFKKIAWQSFDFYGFPHFLSLILQVIPTNHKVHYFVFVYTLSTEIHNERNIVVK